MARRLEEGYSGGNGRSLEGEGTQEIDILKYIQIYIHIYSHA